MAQWVFPAAENYWITFPQKYGFSATIINGSTKR